MLNYMDCSSVMRFFISYTYKHLHSSIELYRNFIFRVEHNFITPSIFPLYVVLCIYCINNIFMFNSFFYIKSRCGCYVGYSETIKEARMYSVLDLGGVGKTWTHLELYKANRAPKTI